MERTLARLLLSVGLLAASLTLSGWWTQRTVLDPSQTSRMVDAVVSQPEVRDELVKVISTEVAQRTGLPQAQVAATVKGHFNANTDLSFLGPLVTQAHSRLLGDTTGPVTLDPALVAPLVGPELAQKAGTLSWDVPTVAPLKRAKSGLGSLLSLGLLLATGLVTAGFLLHPRKDHALRMIGGWAIGACFWQLAVAYLFPVVILPHLTDNPWVGIASALARARLAPLVGILLSLAGAGVACILLSLFMGGTRRVAPSRNFGPTGSVPLGGGVGPAAGGSMSGGSGPRPGWAWPANRVGKRRAFGAAHRRTTSGEDPEHEGDWLL